MPDNSQPLPPTIIFVHILKTGGMTLNTIIEKHYSPDRTYSTFPSRHHPQGSLETFHQFTEAQKAKLDVLYGHMSYGLHEYLPRSAVYFTLLRDPVDRVISRYYHIHRDPKSLLHEEIQSGQMDLVDFTKHMAEAGQMDNLQTRVIAGNWVLRGYGECDEQMLATAKENLKKFAVIGLMERFDETCLLLQRAFGWRDVYYTKRNVTKSRPLQADIPDQTLQILQAHNQFDMALYEYAVELFEKQVRQQGPSFAKDVQLYQWKNGRLSSLRQLYWQAREISIRNYIKNLLRR